MFHGFYFKVAGIILRGNCLMRKKELDWFYKGGAAAIYSDGVLLCFISISLSLSGKDLSANNDKDISRCILTDCLRHKKYSLNSGFGTFLGDFINGVLSACSHGGFIDKVFYYFKAMIRCYGLTPRHEHCGCMVDLLGWANLLVEAVKFIMSFPVRSDVVMWRSLLFACRSHGNIELAEFAANQIEELEARKCGACVLLSNVYASASRWSDVKVDSSHPQINDISETIFGINKILQPDSFDSNSLDYEEQWDGV
ncbi:hypothetical protein ACSBR1_040138 [Camellia fascicularis]